MRKSNATREPRPPLRLIVNPLAVWTDLMLKGGGIASMEAAAARARSARVDVIPTVDARAAPAAAARDRPRSAPKGKPRTKAKRKAKARRR